MSRLRRTALAVCGVLALSACQVDVTVHVDVADDGSGTITMTAIADADVVARAPGLADDLLFDDAVAAGWTVDGPTATEAGGLRVEISHDFATLAEASALLQSINGTGGPMHDVVLTQVVTSAQITTFLNGTLRVDGGLDAFADSDLVTAIGGGPYVQQVRDEGLTPTDAVTFTFTANLPGESIAKTPSALSWTVPMDGTAAELAATTAIARGGTGIWSTVATVALIALLVWGLVAIAFIAFVAKARRRRARAAAAAAGGFRVRPLTRR